MQQRCKERRRRERREKKEIARKNRWQMMIGACQQMPWSRAKRLLVLWVVAVRGADLVGGGGG